MKLESRMAHARCQYLDVRVKLLILTVCMCAAITELRGSTNAIGVKQCSASENQLTFRPTLSSSGRTAEGSRFSLQLYESSDGIAVSSRVDRFGYTDLAQKEFAKIVRMAQVIERPPKLDGQRVGERVVLKFNRNKPRVSRIELLWIDNTDLHRIVSSSLGHIVEFERQFYPSAPQNTALPSTPTRTPF